MAKAAIAETRQPRRDLLGMVRQARPFMADQHASATTGLAVVDDVLADHADAVGGVVDVLGAHLGHLPPQLRRRLKQPA
jgi:hypothetical protein